VFLNILGRNHQLPPGHGFRATKTFETQRQSTFGQYLKRMMTHKIEAIRLSGDIVMVLGAWSRYHRLSELG
jgi:hypothetical protein